MSVKAKYIKDLPLKEVLDGSESLLVQDLNGTQQAPLGTIVDEIKQNSQEKIREIENGLSVIYVDNYANINEAISCMRDGYVLKFSAREYTVDEIILNVAATIDLNGATVNLTNNRTRGAIGFKSNVTYTSTGTVTSNNTVHVDSLNQSIKTGFLVSIKDSNSRHNFLTTIKNIDFETNTITLTDNIVHNSVSGCSLAFIKPLVNCVVKNGTIKELNQHTNKNFSCIEMHGCYNSLVHDVKFEKWSGKAINFEYCYINTVERCSGYDALVKTDGLGYFCRFGIATNNFLQNSFASNVRHFFDAVNTYNTLTENNKCYLSTESAYSLHGHLSYLTRSINDQAISCASLFAIGNNSFGGDYNVSISGFKAYNCEYGLSVLKDSCNVTVKNCDIHTTGISVDLLNSKGNMIIDNSTFVSDSNYCLRIKNTSDEFDVTFNHCDLKTYNTSKKPCGILDTLGDITFMYCSIFKGHYGLQFGYTTICRNAKIKHCEINDTTYQGVKFENRPTGKVVIEYNDIFSRDAKKTSVSLNKNNNDIIANNNFKGFTNSGEHLACQSFMTYSYVYTHDFYEDQRNIAAGNHTLITLSLPNVYTNTIVNVIPANLIDDLAVYAYVKSKFTLEIKIFNISNKDKLLNSAIKFYIYTTTYDNVDERNLNESSDR